MTSPLARLTPLTGHRHLAALAVGATTPIDLAPLRTLPALCALDLSRWPAVGVALLAAVPGLRYPALPRPVDRPGRRRPHPCPAG
ncbi:hypothetical protein ACFQ1I_00065 [Kitasatospora arboriphila]